MPQIKIARQKIAETIDSRVGQHVRVTTFYGDSFTGTLSKLSGYSAVVVAGDGLRHRINLSQISSIEVTAWTVWFEDSADEHMREEAERDRIRRDA